MTILDKYVLRTFLPALIAATVMLLFMYCMVDFLQRADRFMKLPSSETVEAIAQYYVFRAPIVFVKLAPMIGLAAAMITIVRFVRANEFIPVAASGVSVHRVLLPMFLCLGLVLACVVLTEEFVIPACARMLIVTESKLDRGKETGASLVSDSLGNRFYMGTFKPATNTMRDVMVNTVAKDGKLTGEIAAESARWVPGQEESPDNSWAEAPLRRGRWVFSRGRYQAYEDWRRVAGGFREFGEDGLFVVSDLTPEMILTHDSVSMYMTFGQLKDMVMSEPRQPHLRVKLHNRLAYPVAVIIVPAIGMSLLLIWRPHSYLTAVALAILAAAGYFAVHLLLLNMGNVGQLNYLAAVWAPVFIFGAVAIFLLDMIKT